MGRARPDPILVVRLENRLLGGNDLATTMPEKAAVLAKRLMTCCSMSG